MAMGILNTVLLSMVVFDTWDNKERQPSSCLKEKSYAMGATGENLVFVFLIVSTTICAPTVAVNNSVEKSRYPWDALLRPWLRHKRRASSI